MDTKSSGVIGLSVIIAALVVVILPRAFPQSTPVTSDSPDSIRSPEGRLVVSFTVTTSKSQTSESWQSGDIDGVTAIEFRAGVVTVQTKEGSGTVFFPDKTKALNWKLKKSE